MASGNGPGQINWELIPDTSAELFGDLSSARDALAGSKFASAEKIGMSILARLPGVTRQTGHESAIPMRALQASAETVVGIAAHEQGQSDAGRAHLTTATSVFDELLNAGYELDAVSRGEYIRALLLTGRAGAALEITRAALESGRVLSPPAVLQVASTLLDAGRTEPAIDLLRLAHQWQPGSVDVADALARALEEDDQQDAAARAHLEAAVLLARQQDYAESEAHFRRSLAGAPGSPAAISGLAQVLLAQGKTEQAVKTVQIAADQGLQAPEIAAVRAEALAKAGDITHAIEAAREGLDAFADNPALIRTCIRILIDARRTEDAAPLLERALADDPNDADLLQAKAEVLVRRGEAAEAIAIMRPLVEEFPDFTRHRATLVRALIAARDELAASEVLTTGLSMNPDDHALLGERDTVADSLVQYARQHLNETENPSVRIALERALTLDQANWLAHAWLGDILRRKGEFTQARDHLDLAADAMPNSAWVAGTRGQVLYALGQPEALDELRRGADLDVNGALPWLHAQLGDAYRLARRYHEALAELARATTLAPGDAWAWALTGATQSLLADWEEARSSLDKAIGLDPRGAWALAVKASLLAKIDEADNALHTICAALDADPKIYWAWGLKSSLLDRLDLDADEQEQAAREGLKLQRDDIFLLISLAEALLRKRQDAAAESCFRAVVDSAAASSELRVDDLQHIAWCHLRLHNYDQALDYLSALQAKNYKISVGYSLGLVLLCAGRQGVALDEYEEGAARTRLEPHAGRRRNLARVARHDLQRMLEQGQIKPVPDVEKVKQVLDQMLPAGAATEHSDDTPRASALRVPDPPPRPDRRGARQGGQRTHGHRESVLAANVERHDQGRNVRSGRALPGWRKRRAHTAVLRELREMTEGTGEGKPVGPDDQLHAMRGELYPVPSLTRISSNAKFTVSAVSVMATALTAFGLITAAPLSAYPPAQPLAYAAVGIALLALVCALSYLALRLEKRNYENNKDVRKWYEKQFKRAGLVVAASWLLILAVVFAGTAGVTAAIAAGRAAAPVLGLVVTGTGPQRTVTATVSIGHLEPGQVVTLRVTSGTGQVVIAGETNADSHGNAKLDATVQNAPGNTGYRLEVLLKGRERAMLHVP